MKEIDRDELITLCSSLIKIPSLSGQEKDVAVCLQDKMLALGFDEVTVDELGSVIGKISGTGDGPVIILDGHIDTVDIGDVKEWTHGPYDAGIAEDKMYGRGTSDMKGALSAMVYAASRFTEDRLPGDLYVTGTVHEEMFEGVALEHILDTVSADYVIIGEASELNLKNGQRGRAEIGVRTHGKSCHSANPSHGKNAVYMMNEAISQLQGITLPEDSFLGNGIMELTDIKSAPYPGASVVPAECLVTYDRRLLTGETKEQVIREVREELSAFTDSEVSVTISKGDASCYTGKDITAERFFPAWYFPETEPFVQKALKGLHDAGFQSELQTYSFCTNGSASAGKRNIPTLGFGPSAENQAHVSDEYIELDQLIKVSEGYCAIVEALMN